jgi:hypothetical protein
MRRLVLPFVCAAIALSVDTLPAAAQNATVSISVNGSPVTFDQPPIERAGRVYVPLRGVFEQLGASVVYANGQINATRGATTVALTIGSTTATVNGQSQQLDSPPFVVGARTLVPLRFVAQALGANVSYNSSNDSVAITQAIASEVVTPRPVLPPPMPPAPPSITALRLVRPEPEDQTTVDGGRPQISATFPSPVRPDSLHIRLDDRDIANQTYISDRSFSYEPSYDLPFGVHRIRVEGQLVDGPRFFAQWSFANRPVQAANFFRDLTPHNGDRVGFAFTVHGFTRPGAVVHITAVSSDRLPFGIDAQSTSNAGVTAGPNGEFARDLAVDNAGGSTVDVRIISRAPDGAIATATLRLRP